VIDYQWIFYLENVKFYSNTKIFCQASSCEHEGGSVLEIEG
jgi:hypothetical protein